MSQIIFQQLTESHFPLLLKWLNTPHVLAWWSSEHVLTEELVEKKYHSYTKGYKLENGEVKKINPYIIYVKEEPIGYIQIYNAYDFPRSAPLTCLPKNLLAFDIFIGDKNFLGQGMGSKAIEALIDIYCRNKLAYIFADPDSKNVVAIKAYEKAGFIKVKNHQDTNEIWMLRSSAGKIN